MNREQFDSHDLWKVVDGAAVTMSEIDSTKDLEAIRGLDEFRGLLVATREVGVIDPDRISVAMLDRLSSAWSQIQSNLAAYQQNPNRSYLGTAISLGDTVRDALALVPNPVARGAAKAAATRDLRSYQSELDMSRERLVERLNEVLASSEAREAAMKEQTAEFDVAVNRRIADLQDLEKSISAAEQRISDSMTSQAETFIGSQASRETEFQSWLKERSTAFGDLATPYVSRAQEAASRADGYLGEVAALRDETVEMAGLAAGDILSTKYGEYARSERRTALVAYIAGGVLAVAGLFAIVFLFGTVTAALSWQQVALKLGVTVGASGVAAVAFRTGGLAVRRATSFKRQELELRALQPFLKDVEGADPAKTAFLDRAFGHAWSTDVSRKVSEPELSAELLRTVLAVMQQAQKISPPQ